MLLPLLLNNLLTGEEVEPPVEPPVEEERRLGGGGGFRSRRKWTREEEEQLERIIAKALGIEPPDAVVAAVEDLVAAAVKPPSREAIEAVIAALVPPKPKVRPKSKPKPVAVKLPAPPVFDVEADDEEVIMLILRLAA